MKEWMMVWKSINCLPLTIGPTDIIPLVNRIFHKSYGSINSNLKALADRGWNPPNRKLLEHKELIDDSLNQLGRTHSPMQLTSILLKEA